MPSVPAIASYATGLSQAQVRSDVNTAVAKKTLDTAKAQGDAAVSLLEQAAELQDAMIQNTSPLPHLGQHLDVMG